MTNPAKLQPICSTETHFLKHLLLSSPWNFHARLLQASQYNAHRQYWFSDTCVGREFRCRSVRDASELMLQLSIHRPTVFFILTGWVTGSSPALILYIMKSGLLQRARLFWMCEIKAGSKFGSLFRVFLMWSFHFKVTSLWRRPVGSCWIPSKHVRRHQDQTLIGFLLLKDRLI